mgnify:CR=1 FL=1
MTQLTEEHFELHTKNKAEQHERQKIKFLEDRITTLEKSIERLNKIVSIWKLGQEENNHERLCMVSWTKLSYSTHSR